MKCLISPCALRLTTCVCVCAIESAVGTGFGCVLGVPNQHQLALMNSGVRHIPVCLCLLLTASADHCLCNIQICLLNILQLRIEKHLWVCLHLHSTRPTYIVNPHHALWMMGHGTTRVHHFTLSTTCEFTPCVVLCRCSRVRRVRLHRIAVLCTKSG